MPRIGITTTIALWSVTGPSFVTLHVVFFKPQTTSSWIFNPLFQPWAPHPKLNEKLSKSKWYCFWYLGRAKGISSTISEKLTGRQQNALTQSLRFWATYLCCSTFRKDAWIMLISLCFGVLGAMNPFGMCLIVAPRHKDYNECTHRVKWTYTSYIWFITQWVINLYIIYHTWCTNVHRLFSGYGDHTPVPNFTCNIKEVLMTLYSFD